ncbi:hypothetical protein BSKO_07305 [Bryopsis sp. KO-2023]|nr:hypothetical protein BSKO_07305 [Bryopsis sp. KO-2023]
MSSSGLVLAIRTPGLWSRISVPSPRSFFPRCRFDSFAKQGRTRAVKAMSTTDATEPAEPPPPDPVVQYVVLRKDLWTKMEWPLGSIVAQACHASTAALWMFKDDPVTTAYCEDIDHMHKVVLEIKSDTQLENLSKKLTEANVLHKLWVEQPENFVTGLATKPYPKSEVSQLFKKLKLCKGT